MEPETAAATAPGAAEGKNDQVGHSDREAAPPIRATAAVWAAYSALFLGSGFLFFWNLGDRVLWSDEAETAVLARSITVNGVPRLDERHGWFAYPIVRNMPGWVDEHKLFVVTPWLDEYLAAVPLAIWPDSAAAARAPFALIGWLSAALLAVVAYRLYGSHAVALAVLFLYVTCVPVLVHSRQCRYYALLLFGQAWLLFGVVRAVGGARRSGAMHMTLAMLTLFYSNFLALAGDSVALVAVALLRRRQSPAMFPAVAWAGSLSLALAAPWFLVSRPQQYGIGYQLSAMPTMLAQFVFNGLGRYVVPVWAAVVLPLVGRRRRASTPSERTTARATAEQFCWLQIALHLGLLSGITFAPFAYLLPTVPTLILLIGAAVCDVARRPMNRCLLLALVAIPQFMPDRPAIDALSHVPLLTFVREITTPYTDRVEALIAYLNAYAQEGETLAVVDNELPLVFHTALNVHVWWETTCPAHPEWMLVRSASQVHGGDQAITILPDPETLRDYDRIVLSVPKTPWRASHPSPTLHEPLTAREREALILYRRRPAGS